MKSKKILVIEDNDLLLKSITRALKAREYEVVEARDGFEGLRALEQKPDLIWLDIYLPEFDGFDFLNKIRNVEKYCHIPIVVVTVSVGNDEVAQHFSGVNIVAHFIKSDAKLADIINKIDSILS